MLIFGAPGTAVQELAQVVPCGIWLMILVPLFWTIVSIMVDVVPARPTKIIIIVPFHGDRIRGILFPAAPLSSALLMSVLLLRLILGRPLLA